MNDAVSDVSLEGARGRTPTENYPSTLVPSQILRRTRLSEIATANKERYSAARPFPHLVVDGLFEQALLEAAIRELPDARARWDNYNKVNEQKHVCSDVSAFGPAAENLVHALNSSAFVTFLDQLTGIEGLIPDPHLAAAGYMRVEPGGFLKLHEDFTAHRNPVFRFERRINVLLYLNADWRPEWGGQLELHSSDALDSPRHHAVSIEPLFNRMVIFNTSHAVHGHPQPVACPSGRARLCLSWYYYTTPPTLEYRARSRRINFVGDRTLRRTLFYLSHNWLPPALFRVVGTLHNRFVRR